ncbi:MAG: elongation factor P [Oscillospiraceae bacterium]
MINAGEFRNGLTFEYDGGVFQIVEFQHVKPGKGAAFVRTKMKNAMTGAIVEKTFNPTEKFEKAMIERYDMEYLYNDGGLYYFMNPENYEQIPISEEQLGDAIKFLLENMTVKFLSFKGNVFSVEPPTFVELKITASEPGVKGNTASNVTKPATVESGAIVNVPMFVNEGDVIRIDTRTGDYMERV